MVSSHSTNHRQFHSSGRGSLCLIKQGNANFNTVVQAHNSVKQCSYALLVQLKLENMQSKWNICAVNF